MSFPLPRSFSANNVGIQSPMNHIFALNDAPKRSMIPSQINKVFQPRTGMMNPSMMNINPATPTMSGRRYFEGVRSYSFSGRPIAMVIVLLSLICSRKGPILHLLPLLIAEHVTILVVFRLRRLRRRGGGEERGHPAPHQGALQAPWNPLLNSYFMSLYNDLLSLI
jgi:hypothetical protein